MRLPPIRITAQVDSPALRSLYGAQEPFVYAGFTGQPLTGVGVYAHAQGPHWHYVSFGLRRRFERELSFRLRADDVQDPADAPVWPVRLLQEFARLAVRSQRAFARGHYLRLTEPLAPTVQMRSGAIVPDPELADDYLQVVGLHESELRLMGGDGWTRFLDALRARDALLVTDPARPSLAA
jgi:hypothetical protein